MVTKNVEKALNEQIIKEEHSSRLYVAMASWCERNGFPGATSWLYAQAEEERMHMLKLVHYLNDRGGHALMDKLEAPANTYKSLKDIFQQVLKHEEFISASINEIYAVSQKEKDFTTANFLLWYINEQIEEESNARNILDQINLTGTEKGGQFLMDKELSALAAAKIAAAAANPPA